MPRHDSELMRRARELARLENKRRGVRAELRRLDKEIRTAARMLRELAAAVSDPDWHESGAASKILGRPAAKKGD